MTATKFAIKVTIVAKQFSKKPFREMKLEWLFKRKKKVRFWKKFLMQLFS
jgi:hypothetical protein